MTIYNKQKIMLIQTIIAQITEAPATNAHQHLIIGMIAVTAIFYMASIIIAMKTIKRKTAEIKLLQQQPVQGFAALPHVQQELDAIHAQFANSHILENKDFQNNALSEALISNPYRIVHIASHGQFSRNPKETFLLTYDGRLTMDLLEQYLNASKYREQAVELLTLSACQTATGDDRAALGMAGVAIKAGARSALASLWFINDAASSDLIALFYGNLKQHNSKAQALRQAQRSLLKDVRYHHASYWSPFLLIGNWL